MDETSKRTGISPFVFALVMATSGWLGVGVALAQPPGDPGKLADYFGFQPLEIYKLERRIGNLLVKDMDGDRTADIVVANNARSRIDLLLSSKRTADEAETRPFRKEANELETDKRLRL